MTSVFLVLMLVLILLLVSILIMVGGSKLVILNVALRLILLSYHLILIDHMNKVNYLFITGVAAYIHTYSQFPQDVCNWIACSFALESSFGESSLAHSNHNYCGMKNPLVRISSAIYAGDPLYHWAQYDDLFSCCVDYLFCLQYHKPISTNYDTIPHFASFVSKFYCPERDYIDKVNRIYSQFKIFNHE